MVAFVVKRPSGLFRPDMRLALGNSLCRDLTALYCPGISGARPVNLARAISSRIYPSSVLDGYMQTVSGPGGGGLAWRGTPGGSYFGLRSTIKDSSPWARLVVFSSRTQTVSSMISSSSLTYGGGNFDRCIGNPDSGGTVDCWLWAPGIYRATTTNVTKINKVHAVIGGADGSHIQINLDGIEHVKTATTSYGFSFGATSYTVLAKDSHTLGSNQDLFLIAEWNRMPSIAECNEITGTLGAALFEQQQSRIYSFASTFTAAQSYSRALTANSNLSASLAKSASLVRVLTDSSAASAGIAKSAGLIRSVSGAATASLENRRQVGAEISAGSSASASMTRLAINAVTASASRAVTAAVSRTITLTRSASRSASASASKAVAMTRSATSSVSASLDKALAVARTLSASASSTATIATLRSIVAMVSAAGSVTASLASMQSFLRTLTATIKAWSSIGGVQITFESHAATDDAMGGDVESDPFDLPPHRLVVVFLRKPHVHNVFTFPASVTDTAGNTYYPLTIYAENGDYWDERAYYAWNCKPAENNVILADYGSSASLYMHVVVYAGADATTDPFEDESCEQWADAEAGTYSTPPVDLSQRGVIAFVQAGCANSLGQENGSASVGFEKHYYDNGARFSDRIVAPGQYEPGITLVDDGYLSSPEVMLHAIAFRAHPPSAWQIAVTATTTTVAASLAKLRTLVATLSGAASATADLAKLAAGALELAATAIVTGSFARQIGRTMTGTSNVIAAALRSLSAALTATSTVTGVVSTLASVLKTLTASASASASLVWRLGRQMSATVTGTAAMTRAIALVRSVGVSVTASVSRGAEIALQAAGSVQAALVRQVGMIRSASRGASASLARSYGRIMSATSSASASLAMRLGLVLAASRTVAASYRRQISLIRSASQPVAATIVNGFEQVLIATRTVTASLAQGFVTLGSIVFRYVVRPALFWRSKSVDPSVDAETQVKPSVDADRRIRDE